MTMTMKKIPAVFFVAVWLTVFSGFAAEGPVRLTHDSAAGVTVIRWKPFANPTRFYNVYRYSDPITPANLYFAERVAARLSPGTADFAVRVNGSGTWYYAVSTCAADGTTNTLFTRPRDYGPIVETDRTPPRPPQLRYDGGDFAAPRLSWDAPLRTNPEKLADWEICRYVDHRIDGGVTVRVPVVFPASGVATFVDFNPPEGIQYYGIAARDRDGNRSRTCAPVIVIVPPDWTGQGAWLQKLSAGRMTCE